MKGAAAVIGTPLLAGVAAADDAVRFELKQQAINPDSEGLIPTRVHVPGSNWFPDEVFFGQADEFVVERGAGGEVLQVGLPENATEVLANPVQTQAVPGSNWDMHFRTQDVDFSGATGGDLQLGLGFFPDETFVPGDHWDTDRARLVP